MRVVRDILILFLVAVLVYGIPLHSFAADGANWNNGAGAWAMDYDLSTADVSFVEDGTLDATGISVAIGNFNCDAYEDVLIGSSGSDIVANANEGKAYLFFGNAAGLTGLGLNADLSTNANVAFSGESSNANTGQVVLNAGDVNGDNCDDLLIAAPYRNGGNGNSSGEVYLIFGKAAGWANITLNAADASFIGERAFGYQGRELAGNADVNGDGFDDILIGGDQDSEAGANSGQAYLILGKAGAWAMDTNLSTASASFWPEASGERAGRGLALANVNGDTYADIIIGVYGNDVGGADAGQTYIIFGKNSGWAMDTNLSTANASFIGEEAGDNSGNGVGNAGDVNGDGFEDILISAYGSDYGGADAGQTYLILGKSSGWAMDTDLSAADASFVGEGRADQIVGIPASLAGNEDINRDGYDDFLIGDLYNGAAASGAGQVYLFYGSPLSGAWGLHTSLANANASFWGEGNNNGGDGAGRSVALGDIDGDNYDDLLIGSWRSRNGAINPGEVYLILSPTPSLPTANAGTDQTVQPDTTATLNGAGSVGATSYTWTQRTGTAVTLSSATASSPTFRAPPADTTLTFRLVVSNAWGHRSDLVNITVLGTHDETEDDDADDTNDEGTADANGCVRLMGETSREVVSGETVILDVQCASSAGEAVELEEEPYFYWQMTNKPATVTLEEKHKIRAWSEHIGYLRNETDLADRLETTVGRTYGSRRNSVSTLSRFTSESLPSTTVVNKTIVWVAPEVESEETFTFLAQQSDSLDTIEASISSLPALAIKNAESGDSLSVTVTVIPRSSSLSTLSEAGTEDASYVVASADQIAAPGAEVNFYAQADASCSINWVQILDGDTSVQVEILDAATLFPSITTPSGVTDLTTLTFQVQCSVGETLYVDTTNILVVPEFSNNMPLADAGANQYALNGSLVTLEGTGYDSDADPVTCTWLQESGISATLTDPQECEPSYYFLGNNETKAFCLVAFDGFSYSTSDCQNSYSGRASGGGIGCSLSPSDFSSPGSWEVLLILILGLMILLRQRALLQPLQQGREDNEGCQKAKRNS